MTKEDSIKRRKDKRNKQLTRLTWLESNSTNDNRPTKRKGKR